MTTIGIVLSGCGVKDGSEIHEAVLTILYLEQQGAKMIFMAPDIEQDQVVNHLTGKKTGETRNVLIESARIARGNIRDIRKVKASEMDGMILPGGFGAVCNLSDFSAAGKKAKVNPDVKQLIRDMVSLKKPVGALCIAPATLVAAICEKKPSITIGHDLTVAKTLEEMGGVHRNCSVDEICVDESNRLVTTPAYMLGPGIKDIAVGIEKLVKKILSMVNS
ncbi:MAG: isoprenoid biosynthesis protein ElbB [Desulfobacteraceae bacterium]|nr:MAG: isoprenoid biosynthesis protein ElbB [Desulfobacteraceae bacterium]